MNGNHFNQEYEQYPSVFSRVVGKSLTAYLTAAFRTSFCTRVVSSALASSDLLISDRPSRPTASYSSSAGSPFALARASASSRLSTPATCCTENVSIVIRVVRSVILPDLYKSTLSKVQRDGFHGSLT